MFLDVSEKESVKVEMIKYVNKVLKIIQNKLGAQWPVQQLIVCSK